MLTSGRLESYLDGPHHNTRTPPPFDRELEEDREVAERLPFGELALLKELVTRDQLEELLHKQARRLDKAGRVSKIGTLLVREGLLSREEAKRLLRIQRAHGPIDGYQLVEHIGSGGMGAVFRAIEKETGRVVALKILPPSATKNSRFRARFLREAQVSARLDHPNLVKSFAHGECEDHLFLAMELIPGTNSRELVRRSGALPESEVKAILRQLLQAMVHYWDASVLHRDIKPENVLVMPDGQAKLADLGLCRDLDDDTMLTRAGKTLGTPLYISPELACGRKGIDIRSDIYSLGATCYYLACGVPPFEGGSAGELLQKHVEERPTSPRLKNARLSKGIDQLLMRLLEKRPQNRPWGPEIVLDALDRLEAGELPFEPLPTVTYTDSVFTSDSAFVSESMYAGESGSYPLSESCVVSDSQVSGPHVWGRLDDSYLPSASASTLPTHEALSPVAPGTPRRRTAALASSSARRWHATSRSRRASTTPYWVAFAFLSLFLGGVFLGSRAGPPSSDAASLEPRESFKALAESNPLRAYDEAQLYVRRRPAQVAEHVYRMDLLLGHLEPGTVEARGARLGLKRARKRLEQQAQNEVEELRTQLNFLIEDMKWEEARACIEAFPDDYQATVAWEDYLNLKAQLADLGH